MLWYFQYSDAKIKRNECWVHLFASVTILLRPWWMKSNMLLRKNLNSNNEMKGDCWLFLKFLNYPNSDTRIKINGFSTKSCFTCVKDLVCTLVAEINPVFTEKHEFENLDESKFNASFWSFRTLRVLMQETKSMFFNQLISNSLKVIDWDIDRRDWASSYGEMKKLLIEVLLIINGTVFALSVHDDSDTTKWSKDFSKETPGRSRKLSIET